MPANFVGPSGAADEPDRLKLEDPGRRRRRAFLWLAALLFAANIAYLVLAGYTETWRELTPIALAALGIAAVGNCLFDETHRVRWLVRLTSILVIVGGVYGIAQHWTSDSPGLPPLFAWVLLTATAGISAMGTCPRTPTDDASDGPISDEGLTPSSPR